MIRRRLNYDHFCLRLVTLLLPFAAFAIAAQIRFSSGLVPLKSADVDPRAYFELLLFTTLAWGLIADHFKMCQLEQLFATSGESRRLISACAITYATILTVTFFYREVSFSRLFIFFSAIALFMLAGITRLGFRALLARGRQNGHCVRILIVGADSFAERSARALVEDRAVQCRVVGFVQLPGQTAELTGNSVIKLDEIESLTTSPEVDDVVIAVPPNRLGEIPSLMTKLEALCVPIRAVLDLGGGVFVRERVFDFGGLLILDLSTTPAESLAYVVFKRTFDILFAFIVICVTAPLMGLIALAIWLSSRGPVLFVQDRVGFNGKLFHMYKFRTMQNGDPTECDTRWTTSDDSRPTGLGHFLRRTNLDELPQFFNVLRGEMSVVGPRPERPFFVEKFLKEVREYGNRHHIKTGITGWAQVNGLRGDTSISKRVEYDLYYMRNWSVWFDMKIILMTLWRAFRDPNAY